MNNVDIGAMVLMRRPLLLLLLAKIRISLVTMPVFLILVYGVDPKCQTGSVVIYSVGVFLIQVLVVTVFI